MATAAADAPSEADGGSSSSSVSSSVGSAPPLAVEAVATEWMLEFACSCLCRHFAEQSGAEFWRWRDVAQGLQFENDQRISPLESALSFWTLLEREEIKLAKLHKDIRLLIQIQIVAVYMENRYFKEAAEVLERLFTDSETDKPLRVKLATVIKTKDPYVPLLQSFSYSNLISKVKSYTELFMKENETNFLMQEATKHVTSKGLGATTLQNRPLKVNENDKSDLKIKKRLLKEEQYITSQSSGDIEEPTERRRSGQKPEKNRVLQSLNNMHNVGRNEVSLCSRKRQRWTHEEDLELKLGVKDFGVGNWTKILNHGNFNNRTSVMLKDRWRTLNKMKQR
ncbi:telomeric repeat binding factor 1 [Turdus rufiventris]|nr:telomeric repeat binding factor 1 [Turdus rufiventris]